MWPRSLEGRTEAIAKLVLEEQALVQAIKLNLSAVQDTAVKDNSQEQDDGRWTMPAGRRRASASVTGLGDLQPRHTRLWVLPYSVTLIRTKIQNVMNLYVFEL